MPLRYEGETVHLDGYCTAEEALPLQEFLLDKPQRRVGMEHCVSLHTALLQVLLAARSRVRALPPSPVLARCIDRLTSPLSVEQPQKSAS
jgi:hypothetical protein